VELVMSFEVEFTWGSKVSAHEMFIVGISTNVIRTLKKANVSLYYIINAFRVWLLYELPTLILTPSDSCNHLICGNCPYSSNIFGHSKSFIYFFKEINCVWICILHVEIALSKLFLYIKLHKVYNIL